MSSPLIDTFLFDEENEDKISARGLSLRQILQVLDNMHIVLKNRKRQRGVFLLIGRDDGGSCIAIPVERTHRPTLWRPITAWPCKTGELTILKKMRG